MNSLVIYIFQMKFILEHLMSPPLFLSSLQPEDTELSKLTNTLFHLYLT